MKWFIKVIRHYADFGGRARRKEYWMFGLFYVIFFVAWIFLVATGCEATGMAKSNTGALALATTVYIYYVLTLLPALAVTVRRLHDLGKSGWWILIYLVPGGVVWLFVQLILPGQYGNNRYGDDPKTSPEIFDGYSKLRSAGVTLTVAYGITVLSEIILLILIFSDTVRGWSIDYTDFAGCILMLAAAIFLLTGSSGYETERKIKTFFYLSLAATVILLVSTLLWITTIKYNPEELRINRAISGFIYLIFLLFLILFFVFQLFAPQNRSLIRAMAATAIVGCVASFLWTVYMEIIPVNFQREYNLSIVFQYVNILQKISLVVLISTFFSGMLKADARAVYDTYRQPAQYTPVAPVASAKTGNVKQYYERDNRGMRVENIEQSMAYWLVERLKNPRKDPFVYYMFKNEQDARKALLDLPFIHVAADTGKPVCDELFRFGYFAVTANGLLTGEYDAFVAGADFTHDMWKKTHEIFTRNNGLKKNDLEPDKNTATRKPATAGNAKNVLYLREDRDGSGSIWRTYKAPNRADAMAFLLQQQITRPLYYVVVETPEGIFGKDKDGLYQE